jgi:ABC-type nitrate/sulfonate/bicarbonate transport system substrate-binding protein
MILEIGKRLGFFRRNGIDLEVVYVGSGCLLTQALIAGSFDVVYALARTPCWQNAWR